MVDLSSFLLPDPCDLSVKPLLLVSRGIGEERGKEEKVRQRHPTLCCGASCCVVVSTLTRIVRDLGSTPSRAQCVAGLGDI